MPIIPAKPTYYRGTEYKSRLEARWAVFFDQLGIPFRYEPYGEQSPDFIFETSPSRWTRGKLHSYSMECKGRSPNEHYVRELADAGIDILAVGGFYRHRTPSIYIFCRKPGQTVLSHTLFFSFFSQRGVATAFDYTCKFRFDLRKP